MSVDTLSFQRGTLLNQPGAIWLWDQKATHAIGNSMHSILLVIPKPERDKPGTERAWKSIVPGLQQCATQARGVKTLYENCWLIPAAENGFSFLDHAITVAESAKLRCRICLLRTPPNGFVHRPSNTGPERLSGTTDRAFQGALSFVVKLLVWSGLMC